MTISKHSINVTTSAGGDFDGTTNVPAFGELMHIAYTPDSASPLDTGADIVVTGEKSGTPIVTKANIGTSAFVLAPRMPTHAVADGTVIAGVVDRIALAGENIRLVVAQGGNALKGKFDFYTFEND